MALTTTTDGGWTKKWKHGGMHCDHNIVEQGNVWCHSWPIEFSALYSMILVKLDLGKCITECPHQKLQVPTGTLAFQAGASHINMLCPLHSHKFPSWWPCKHWQGKMLWLFKSHFLDNLHLLMSKKTQRLYGAPFGRSSCLLRGCHWSPSVPTRMSIFKHCLSENKVTCSPHSLHYLTIQRLEYAFGVSVTV